jgi:hypothetical protein
LLDYHIHRRILGVLEEMQENLSGETRRKDLRPAGEYLAALREMEKICGKGLSPGRRACYDGLLGSLVAAMERLARKRTMGRKDRISCGERMGELLAAFREEKEVKKSMVFLPSNASMWDSMESVWKAAQRDAEHCNAYVIPIPYCTKNPDGSPKEWRCEADRFPKEVPLIHWQAVDLEKMHPDIILINTPYEEENTVTSVEQRYYPRNLRKCTDRLVYLPYFVFREADLKNARFLEHVARLARHPGTACADETIVQSEAARQAYIRVLEQEDGVRDRTYWEKHILGLGSPKIEKVRNTGRDEAALPEEWRRIIRGKKVVLYNTSVTEVLHQTSLFLEKIRDTLEAFRRNEKAALWWRPHPLLEATIQSMRPALLDGYLQIVEAYKKEGWGIYDDTGDMHRAIAWSDAFYGDGSSVAILYGMTGKPVLVQNYSVRCKGNKGGGSDG